MTDFAVSGGVLLYRSLRVADTALVWRDRAERQSVLVNAPAEYYEPTLSPDQARVAIDVFDPRPSPRFGFNVGRVTSDIWILDASTGRASRFTFDPAADFDPVWSPNGDRIVFSSNRRGPLDLYLKRVGGDAREEPLLESPLSKHAQSWSPDGRFLVYATFEPGTKGRPVAAADDRRSHTGAAAPHGVQRRAGVDFSGRALVRLHRRRIRDAPSRTCSRFHRPAARSGRFRAAAAAMRAGVPTARSCSTSPTIAG